MCPVSLWAEMLILDKQVSFSIQRQHLLGEIRSCGVVGDPLLLGTHWSNVSPTKDTLVVSALFEARSALHCAALIKHQLERGISFELRYKVHEPAIFPNWLLVLQRCRCPGNLIVNRSLCGKQPKHQISEITVQMMRLTFASFP